jgi:deoxyuridine 5'-triphosphate nucleotidohydrolase
VRWTIPYRVAHDTRARNEGRIICVFCSRALKNSGRANPNCAYPTLDDGFFSRIDSEEKAYLLGWIASDGAIQPGTVSLYIHRHDEPTLYLLRDVICPELPVRSKKRNLVGFTISSQRIVRDLCRLLRIAPGKKDAVVAFPDLDDDRLRWAFLRGFFDGDGSVSTPRPKGRHHTLPYPRCDIASTSPRMLDTIQAFCGIPSARLRDRLEWWGNNALDFMSRLYDGASLYLSRKRDLYIDWSCWVPGLGGPPRQVSGLFRWVRTRPDAVAPFKARASDSGFDLTLIDRAHGHGPIQFYRTGVKIQPAFGWYFDLVPRSSIVRAGYALANSVGVIDRTYVGEILVPLVKIDREAPELALPARIVQIVPRPIVHVQWQEVDSLDATARGEGGFGHTGK